MVQFFKLVLWSVLGAWGATNTLAQGLDKKGVGLAESVGLGAQQLQNLQVAWYYSWGPQSAVHSSAQFVPMVFSVRSIKANIHGPVVLGFNEPDNAKQSNMTVPEALRLWPQVVGKAPRVGSPAMAGNPVRGDWLPAFMQGQPKVDFMTLHWYKGADAAKFIRDVQALCEAYQKPVWVTEYAPQTAAQGKASPDKYSQAQVNQFIRETVAWMNASPCVERFAWHDAKRGTSALFDEQGQLTDTGLAYAQAR
ncbi:glycosyl hydrolase [Limnohabitans sp. Jir72]|uniref:glycosyl hydrolase n=1 Tax=Limnohabitans sp. Jir72 TaxID=1977909 RepID=UPI000D36BDFF|nr:glycosyl hydrolase [Limnohabitans sp. Jir72]PUE33425.1 hypothetical protein B9Z52_08590 [Limnohabitans sp. Jir72]